MNNIYVEQILFGYKNGHTLISTSLNNKLKQQKDVEILSDASGKGKFNTYITCFPLVQDGYYVFSKTWYATEMERPGCVWTHMLLIKFDDLLESNGNIDVSKLFHKPESVNDYANYSKPVCCEKQSYRVESPNYNYVIYTMLYSTKNVLIEDNDAEAYEISMIDILTKLPINILKKLSVCTCSFANRYINNEVFSYQITWNGNAKYLARDISNPVIYKSREYISNYPLWVRYIGDKFKENRQGQIYSFCEKYKHDDRNDIRELSKILYSVNEFKEKQNVQSFLTLINKVEIQDELEDRTIEMLYFENDVDAQKWFLEESIIEQLVSEMQNKKGLFVKKNINSNIISKHAKKIYDENNKKRIQKIFWKFINKKLNKNGEKIVKDIIKLMKPNDLYKIFDMDFNISSVLVRYDSKFLLCKYVWLQDKNFQLELLNIASIETLSQKEKVIKCIIKNTKQNITDEVYELFGDAMLNVLSRYCKEEASISYKQYKMWIPYLARKKEVYLDLLSQIKDMNVLYNIMEYVDSYSISDDYELGIWIDTFSNRLDDVEDERMYDCAIFLLPIILKECKCVSNRLIEFVYEKIYSTLEKSAMDYIQWKKIDPLLPQVDIEQSWDKCLRLKLAFQDRFSNIM